MLVCAQLVSADEEVEKTTANILASKTKHNLLSPYAFTGSWFFLVLVLVLAERLVSEKSRSSNLTPPGYENRCTAEDTNTTRVVVV